MSHLNDFFTSSLHTKWGVQVLHNVLIPLHESVMVT